MFTQFFGSYLLNKNLIRPNQLKDALDYQQNTHIKLGVLAINSGYLTAEQVKKTHESQLTQDKKFGEIAIELGFLNNEKLDMLLSTQKHGHLLLGQALIDKNYMTLEQFEAALKSYKGEHSLTDAQFSAIQQDNIDEIIKIFYDFGGSAYKEVYTNYFSLLIKNLIRFIDGDIRPESVTIIDTYKNDWITYQKIKGEINLFTCIAASEEVFSYLGSKYANDEPNATDELIQSSVGELLNMHNGLFLVNMSNNGVELDMEPQFIEANRTLSGMKSAYCIPINMPFGKFDFIISESDPIIR